MFSLIISKLRNFPIIQYPSPSPGLIVWFMMVKDEERDTGRGGTLKLRSWVDISKGACCRENGGSVFDSYKKGVFLQQVCIRTRPTFWLCLASPI